MSGDDRRATRRAGRGAASNPSGRFAATRRASLADEVGEGVGPEADDPGAPLPRLATEVRADASRSVVSRNDSPDVPFSQSINPYRGCEHGCIYCYARPTHAWLGLSPGLDFETKLFYKADAAALLEAELARPGYRCEPISLGANTDPYQPIERELGVTRSLLEVLLRARHPVGIVTKGTLVERDLDLLGELARARLVHVFVSITTLDVALKRDLEPRAASPAARLATLRALSAAGIPCGVLFAPVVPALNDHELERVLEAAAGAGARAAGWVLLRLPHEVEGLFEEWLALHRPLRAAHAMSLVRQARGGATNDPRFHARMRGAGPYADAIAKRFRLAAARFGLDGGLPPYDLTRFRPPGRQLALEL
jgi:DNA repair photolyase